MLKTVLTLALAAGLALNLSGCAQTTSGMSSGRSQLMLVSSDEINTASAKAYDEVIAKARAAGTLNRDAKQTRRVQNIAKRLIAVAPQLRPDAKNWDWEVNVIAEDTVNAWCMAGGKIVVYTGLIEALKPSDAELAVVMGHEMAHALREHSREQASQEYIRQGALTVASLLGVDDTTLSLGNMAAEIGVMLPFSREHETEADTVGLELIYKAGYDVDAGPEVWRKMSKLGASNSLDLLSTHPSDDKRIAHLTELATQLKVAGGRRD